MYNAAVRCPQCPTSPLTHQHVQQDLKRQSIPDSWLKLSGLCTSNRNALPRPWISLIQDVGWQMAEAIDGRRNKPGMPLFDHTLCFGPWQGPPTYRQSFTGPNNTMPLRSHPKRWG